MRVDIPEPAQKRDPMNALNILKESADPNLEISEEGIWVDLKPMIYDSPTSWTCFIVDSAALDAEAVGNAVPKVAPQDRFQVVCCCIGRTSNSDVPGLHVVRKER